MSVSHAPHILIVDDDPEVRALLCAALEPEGFRVSAAGSGAEMLALLTESLPDLITLDLNLGGEDGLKLARDVRARSNVPIVMITGKGDLIDRVVGLELGADDYIAKPFHVREVLARLRAVLRRYAHEPQPAEQAADASSERYKFEDWVLDIGRRELRDPSGEILRSYDRRVRTLEHPCQASGTRPFPRQHHGPFERPGLVTPR